jgi:hypothetical protein
VVIGVVILAVIIILSAILYATVISSDSDSDDDAKTMNMDDLENEFLFSEDFALNFKTLSPGDTVKIRDEIVYIADDTDWFTDEEVTYIWLKSAHKYEDVDDWRDPYDGEYYDSDFTFQGDITDDYGKGDTVEITLHVIEIKVEGFTMEYFSEMWDGDEPCDLPENCIKLIKKSSGNDDDDDDNDVATFPTIEVTLKHGSANGDSLRIKHIQGDPLDWSKFKVILTNNTDVTDTALITDLTSLGQITAGESSSVTELGITGFSDIDYEKGKAYQLEIYNLKENKRVYNRDNIICE